MDETRLITKCYKSVEGERLVTGRGRNGSDIWMRILMMLKTTSIRLRNDRQIKGIIRSIPFRRLKRILN